MPASESDFAALALVHLRPPSQNAAFIAQTGRERLRIEQLQIQAFDLLQCLSCNPLKVAVHANCGFNHTSDLNFTLGPKTGHRFPLPVEVSLHVGESLDNRFDATTKAWPRQILIDQFHFALLALSNLTRG